MPLLTKPERAQVGAWYDACRSYPLVKRKWRGLKGRNARLDNRTIKACHDKLIVHGDLGDFRRSGRPSSSRDPIKVDAVRDSTAHDPAISIRQISIDTRIPKSTVNRVLKKTLSFKPWKPHYCQELSFDDCDRRMAFGEAMLQWHEENHRLFENILWSDEAVFHIGGFVNKHNCHYWAADIPIW